MVLPPLVAQAFCDLADQQRGEPETTMVQAQFALGGGVLFFVIEHTGDLLHRMNQFACSRWQNDAGFEYAADKVAKVLRVLRNPYGFQREHTENMISNARYGKVPLDQYVERVRKALTTYAAAHARLPVYNEVQWHAREAAVALGRERFGSAEDHLAAIEPLLVDPQVWTEAAWAYRATPDGRPAPRTNASTTLRRRARR